MRSEMIIFEPLLTSFKVRNFLGATGFILKIGTCLLSNLEVKLSLYKSLIHIVFSDVVMGNSIFFLATNVANESGHSPNHYLKLNF